MKNPKFTIDQARKIGNEIGIDWEQVDFQQFRAGLEVELEHGLTNAKTNVTGDDPMMTGKIALAHLLELPDYYTRLHKMEYGEGKLEHHYYGDRIRSLFMFAALVMAISLPFIYRQLDFSWVAAAASILVLTVLAGAVSPIKTQVIKINAFASIVAFLVFQYYAIQAFLSGNGHEFHFIINQLLAILFLVAVYFGIKSWRGLSE